MTTSPVEIVYEGLMGFSRECLAIAEDAVAKVAAVEAKLADTLVLTKVAEQRPTLARAAEVADVLIKKGFAPRGGRAQLIQGIHAAEHEELLALLEKTASFAICPSFALLGAEDGEVVEKAAGNTTDDLSKSDRVWRESLDEAAAEVGA